MSFGTFKVDMEEDFVKLKMNYGRISPARECVCIYYLIICRFRYKGSVWNEPKKAAAWNLVGSFSIKERKDSMHIETENHKIVKQNET